MRKILFWLARIFNVNLTVEKIIYKDKIVEKVVEKQIALEGVVDGDLTIKGNLLVTGVLNATGGVACLAIDNSNKNK